MMDMKKKPAEPFGPKISPLPNAIIQDDPKNWTSLHEAAAAGDEKKLQVLLARNVDRTVRESNNGNTPLHEAAWRGYSRCVKLLCSPTPTTTTTTTTTSKKPDSKDKKTKGTKPAIAKGILASTFLDIQNNGGFTALHLAAQNGHNQSCRELLLAGADPDIKNNYGDTPLHTSCRYGHAGATRILISADCDPNKVNLNGDHPLHISCAMGRRKLTRLLLEADCDMNMKNAQGETPRDIAMRKHYAEILEILNNPQRMRNRREKPTKQRSRQSSLPDPTDLNAITWSPYGCHYFPDPRSFPAPKLETLPKEPLKKGEQYYLDLAGHIRKGPIGVGNTCYCGPFFKHIEHKINCNRKSLRRYVHKTKESLDNKVQALAMRTNDQIEQLTRSVIADRVRCESRRLQLHRLLKRGEPLRSTTATTGNHACSKRPEDVDSATLTRSRSMEFMDRHSALSSSMSNAKSCGGLLDETIITVHHQNNEIFSESEEEDAAGRQTAVSAISVDSIDRSADGQDDDIVEEYDIDFYKAAESLSKLLEKAKLLNEIKKAPDKPLDDTGKMNAVSNDNHDDHDIVDSSRKSTNDELIDDELIMNQNAKFAHHQEEPRMMSTKVTNQRNFNNRMIEGEGSRYENISNDNDDDDGINEEYGDTSNAANALGSAGKMKSEANGGNGRMKFFTNLNRQEYTLQNVISALRKDRRELCNQKDFKTTNVTEAISEDKLSYKDENNAFLANTEYHHNHHHSPNSIEYATTTNKHLINTTQHTCMTASKWHAIESKKMPEIKENSHPEPNCDAPLKDPRVSGKIEKVEIKNSEIKLLKKPTDTAESGSKKNRVQELVARLQGKLSATQILSHGRKKRANEGKVRQSESSEDEQNNHNEYKSSIQTMENGNNCSAEIKAISCISNTAHNNNNNNNNSNTSQFTAIQNSSGIDMGASLIGIPVNLPLKLPERIIPKDAYFHELPNKKRNPINVRMFSNGPALSSPMPHDDYVQKRQPYGSDGSSHITHMNKTQNMSSMQTPSTLRATELFPSSSSVHLATIRPNSIERNLYTGYEVSAAIDKNYQKSSMHHLHGSQTQNYVQYVERDISNDSGVSTHFYGGQHGPSPSLSPQTYYPSTERLQSPESYLYSNEMVRPVVSNPHQRVPDSSNVDITIGNVSSLV